MYAEALASYFPKAYAYLHETLDALCREQQELRKNFPYKKRSGSEYPACAFNLGPECVCLDHTDCNNSPELPCHITALGDFNPDTGGHLYLWDLQLIIRFPPGSSILLSSACMRHGNVPIQKGEKRYSFTQYCPGGLMRWVRLGFQTAKSLTKAQRLARDGGHEQRVAEALGRLSKYSELVKDRSWLLRREASWAAAGREGV